jgi:hypothetical protein
MNGLVARFHEQLEVNQTSDRNFGWLVGTVLLVIGLLPLWRSGPVRWWAIALAATVLLGAMAAPHLLGRPKQAWLFLGFLMGLVVSPIVLGILFFAVVTPIAWCMRLAGRDALQLQLDSHVPTYWRTREEPCSDMGMQF